MSLELLHYFLRMYDKKVTLIICICLVLYFICIYLVLPLKLKKRLAKEGAIIEKTNHTTLYKDGKNYKQYRTKNDRT